MSRYEDRMSIEPKLFVYAGEGVLWRPAGGLKAIGISQRG
jgi:hypothetical protein